MTFHANPIGELIHTKPHTAAQRLRVLIRNANGNGRLVAEILGVSERQLGRWMRKLKADGIADLRSYRQRIRKQVPGAIHLDAVERQPDTDQPPG